MRHRRVAATLAATALMLAGVAAAPPATAAGAKLTVTHIAKNMVDFNHPIATCSGGPGTLCDLTQSVSATRTVDLKFGLTRSWVTGELGISSASTRTVAVSCSATLTSKYRRFIAYPVGNQIFYKITSSSGTVSGTLMAFDPYSASQACYLYS